MAISLNFGETRTEKSYVGERTRPSIRWSLFFSFNQPAWFLPSVNSVVTSEIQLFRVDFGSTGRIKEVEERRNAGRTSKKEKGTKSSVDVSQRAPHHGKQEESARSRGWFFYVRQNAISWSNEKSRMAWRIKPKRNKYLSSFAVILPRR